MGASTAMVTSARALRVCAVVAGYLVFNTSINLFNRWCLGMYGFSFPLVVTVCHFSFAFFALTPMMLLVPAYREQHKCVSPSARRLVLLPARTRYRVWPCRKREGGPSCCRRNEAGGFVFMR